MYNDLKKIFASQIRAEVMFENAEQLKLANTKTYFGRKLTASDRMLFTFIVDQIRGTKITMQMAVLTERDFPDLQRKFTLDKSLTDKQFEHKGQIGMPVFVKDKVLADYLYIKGIKPEEQNGRK